MALSRKKGGGGWRGGGGEETLRVRGQVVVVAVMEIENRTGKRTQLSAITVLRKVVEST